MARPLQTSSLNNLVPYRELYKTITQPVYTVQPEDNNDVIIFNAAANATLNLPPANNSEGMIIRIWNNNTSTFTLTIDAHGDELIDGTLTLVLEVNEGTKCQAYQGRWFTRRINAGDLYTSGVVAGSTKQSVLRYNGTTQTAGAFDGGTSNPSATTRLNYGGNFYATNFFGDGSALINLNASNVSSGTLANARTTASSANGASTIVARDAAGSFVANVITATTFSGSGASLTSIPNSATTASSANGASTIVLRDASGSFTANAITSTSISGNGSTLTSLNANNISSGTLPGARGVTAGSVSASFITYNGTTKTLGQFYGGSTAPTNTTRLNYDGNLYATNFFGNGSNLTGISSGLTVSDDTSTNATRYLTFTDQTSGTETTAFISSTKLYFNPSTGTLNATVFNSLSDETLKKNITKITNATDLITLLDGVEFEWAENGTKSSGLIAQWIEKIVPHLVDTGENELKTVNYSGLIAYLIEAVKELNERVKKLESK